MRAPQRPPRPRRSPEIEPADFPVPTEGLIATHLLIVEDVGQTASFYTDNLAGELVFSMAGYASVVKLAEPLDNDGIELRCYMRDPDGRIIEAGQAGAGMLRGFGLTAA